LKETFRLHPRRRRAPKRKREGNERERRETSASTFSHPLDSLAVRCRNLLRIDDESEKLTHGDFPTWNCCYRNRFANDLLRSGRCARELIQRVENRTRFVCQGRLSETEGEERGTVREQRKRSKRERERERERETEREGAILHRWLMFASRDPPC